MARATFDEITTKGKMTATCGVKILAQSTPEELVEAALAFRYKTNIVEETEQRFIPLAATWLNQARYEDQDEDERKEMANKNAEFITAHGQASIKCGRVKRQRI